MHAPALALLTLSTVAGGGVEDPPVPAPRTRVTVVSGEELRSTGERSLPRALASATGDWVFESVGYAGTPVLHGLAGSRVLVTVDGVPVSGPLSRTEVESVLNTVDVGLVETIEVFRGDASATAGGGAIGGVIAIRTRLRDPIARGGGPETRAAVGGTWRQEPEGGRVTGSASGALPDHGWIAVGSLESWGELENGSDEAARDTEYDAQSIFGAWTYAIDDRRTLRLSSRLKRALDAPVRHRTRAGFGQTAALFDRFEVERRHQEGHSLSLVDDERRSFADRLSVSVFYRRYLEERAVEGSGETVFVEAEDELQGIGVVAEAHLRLGERHELRYGIDAVHDFLDVKSNEVDPGPPAVETAVAGELPPDGRYTSASVFAEDVVSDLAGFRVSLGARAGVHAWSVDPTLAFGGLDESESDEVAAVAGSLGIDRALGAGFVASGRVTDGYRAPSLDELARSASSSLGTELSDPGLDPERAFTGEVALDWRRERGGAGVGAWYTNVRDAIGLVPVGGGSGPGDGVFRRENLDHVELVGVEARAEARFPGPDGPFLLGGTLAWVSGRQYDDARDPLTGLEIANDVAARRLPPLHGRGRLRWEPAEPLGWLGWGQVEVVFADEQERLHPLDEVDPTIDPGGTPGWAVLDVDVGGSLARFDERLGHTRWRLGLHNALDQDYRVHGSSFDAPGRSVVAGLHWSL